MGVALAGGAGVLFTNLTILAVGILQATFAYFGGCVTNLARLTSFVVATSSFAGTCFTDGSRSTLLVVLACAALVCGAYFAVCAFVGAPTIAVGTLVLQTQLSGSTL